MTSRETSVYFILVGFWKTVTGIGRKSSIDVV